MEEVKYALIIGTAHWIGNPNREVGDILEMSDPRMFLAGSGWQSGLRQR